jgi:hypothetical protein
MNSKAVVTISIGSEYERLGGLLHPSKRAYARKVGAEFVEIKSRKWMDVHPNFEKLQMYDMLGQFDRVLFLDCDTFVRSGTPDLFTLVPEEYFGAYNESWWGGRADLPPNLWTDYRAPHYGVEPQPMTRYFNSGVMVSSRSHRDVFSFPPGLDRKQFGQQPIDQPWINLQLVSLGTPIRELPYTFNRTYSVSIGERTDAYIIHYNGMRTDSRLGSCPYGEHPLEVIEQDIKKLGVAG